jgi:urease accessory protein
VHLAEDSVLEYIPDHVIPHPGSSLNQSISVDMRAGSSAIILDAFSVGRVARDEMWLFEELTTDLAISLDGQPHCRDRIRLQPEVWTPSGLGGLEGAAYAATMVLCADRRLDWHGTANAFTSWFAEDRNSVGAASALTNGGCLLRYFTRSAHGLNQATRTLWAMARRDLLGQPPLDLRKG